MSELGLDRLVGEEESVGFNVPGHVGTFKGPLCICSLSSVSELLLLSVLNLTRSLCGPECRNR